MQQIVNAKDKDGSRLISHSGKGLELRAMPIFEFLSLDSLVMILGCILLTWRAHVKNSAYVQLTYNSSQMMQPKTETPNSDSDQRLDLGLNTDHLLSCQQL